MSENIDKAKRLASVNFHTDPDYRNNPFKKDSREYHVYLNEINSLETKESMQIAQYGVC